MATFSYTADFGAQKAQAPETTKVKFGDGYEQRYPKGLNNNPQVWDLRFNQRSADDANAINDFLTARGGWEAFEWIPPDAVDAILVVCESWNKVIERNNLYSLSTTFREVFEPS